jgi:hypothetical protein
MFYNDRFGGDHQQGQLEKLLVVGKGLVPVKVQNIASEALGRELKVLSHSEVGLDLPGGVLTFDDIAAPAGLAALGVR